MHSFGCCIDDEARRNVEVAKAELDTARKQAELVNAPPLPEEVARADADVSAAESSSNRMSARGPPSPMGSEMLLLLPPYGSTG